MLDCITLPIHISAEIEKIISFGVSVTERSKGRLCQRAFTQWDGALYWRMKNVDWTGNTPGVVGH